MKLEDEVSQLVRLEAPKMDVTLFRNNNGAFTDTTGRTVRFGLGNESKRMSDQFKSSDLIGIHPMVVTPGMVGKTIGVFVAIECKKEDWNPKNFNAREIAQQNFIDFIKSKGGIAGFCNSVKDFVKLINDKF